MGIFSRLGDIINSNVTSLLDRAEDPEKIARLIVQEMEETLVEVRTAAARTLAEKRELERKLAELSAAEEDWQTKAELALAREREELARGALVAKAKAAEAAEALRRELTAVAAAIAKTNDDMRQLQGKIDEAKAKQRAMAIRRQSASDRIRVRSKLHDGRIDDALARYELIERRLDELEGQADAFDLGRPGRRGPSAGQNRTLAEEFADLEAETAIEAELAALKQRLGKTA